MTKHAPIKLAIIGSRGYPYVYSGYETFVKELVERLVDKGVDVTVYCHKALFKERPKTYKGVKLKYVPSVQSKVLSQLTSSFLAMCHACFSDTQVILVVNSANGPFGLLARIFRKKTLINVDGLEWKRPKWKGLGSRYFYFSSWLSTRLFDVVINDSDAMREVYLKTFGTDSEVIAYGAKKRYSQNASLVKKWGLVPMEYYLIVGRLIPDNNSDLIIEGFVKSNSKRKLVVVGDVPYHDSWANQIKERAKTDDRLIFTGYVTDPEELAELYHNSYCYLHGHEYGGTNPTMLKAMAYGCAIVALNTPFNQEMLQNGKYGQYFEKNPQNVCEVINRIDPDNQVVQAMKSSSRDGIIEKYDWDYVTAQYLTVIRQLALGRG